MVFVPTQLRFDSGVKFLTSYAQPFELWIVNAETKWLLFRCLFSACAVSLQSLTWGLEVYKEAQCQNLALDSLSCSRAVHGEMEPDR